MTDLRTCRSSAAGRHRAADATAASRSPPTPSATTSAGSARRPRPERAATGSFSSAISSTGWARHPTSSSGRPPKGRTDCVSRGPRPTAGTSSATAARSRRSRRSLATRPRSAFAIPAIIGGRRLAPCPRRISRRQFVKAGVGAGVAAAVVRAKAVARRRHLVPERKRVQERRPANRGARGVRADRARRGRPGRDPRGRQHRRARSRGRQRRLRRHPERRRRRAARRVRDARTEEARGRRRGARRRPHAEPRRESGDGPAPTITCSSAPARSGSRASMGFTIEDDLNTEHSRKLWLEWKRRIDPAHYLDPDKRVTAGDRARDAMLAGGLLVAEHVLRHDPHERRQRRAERSAARRRRAGCRSRSRAAWAIRRSWAPGTTSTGRGRLRLDRPRRGQPLRPVVVLSSSRRCGAARTRRTRSSRRCGGSRRARSKSGCLKPDGTPIVQRQVLRDERRRRARRHGDVLRGRARSTPCATRPDPASSPWTRS